MAADRPDLPIDRLRAAVPNDSKAQAAIDALHAELGSDQPAPDKIKEHVATLRRHAPLTTLIANWFEDPRTQAFIDELTATGL